MTSGTDRIALVGLSLADAHRISDELRSRSMDLRDQECEQRTILQSVQGCDNAVSGTEAIISAIRFERHKVLAAREALSAAIAQTFNGLG